MATTPGTQVIAQGYHDYMIIYTAGEKVEVVVDGAPPGPNGRLFTVEPNKPVKVPYEAGRFMLDHLAYTGVVRVDETQTDTGTKYDLEKAKADSLEKFEAEDARRWRDYVEYCLTDKMDKKKAVPATPDAIRRIMARRGYRLSEFGITPVGEIQGPDPVVAELKAEVARLSKMLHDALGEPEDKKGKRI